MCDTEDDEGSEGRKGDKGAVKDSRDGTPWKREREPLLGRDHCFELLS